MGHRRFIGRSAGGSCPSYTPGLYTAEEIDTLVFVDGYIPVASVAEFDAIRTGSSETMGAGTCWAGTYITGTTQKYIQIKNIDFTSFGTWGSSNQIGNPGGFSGIYDGNELVISNITQTFSLFILSASGSLKNIRLTGASCTSPTNAIILGISTALTQSCENCTVTSSTATTSGSFQACVVTGLATYTDCHFSATLSAGSAGGVYGLSGGNYLRCSASGSVTVTNSANGVCGWVGSVASASTFTECLNSVDVTANGGASDQIGGYIGINTAAVTFLNCVFDGSVIARNAVGGFIGDHRGGVSSITNSVMYGNLTASGALFGGICSRVAIGSFTASNTYWDTTLGPATSTTGTGQTTSALQTPTSNTGIYSAWTIPPWDFETASEYPTLTTTP